MDDWIPVSKIPATATNDWQSTATWQGSMLPISQDAQGHYHFDPNAGIVGMGKNLIEHAIGGATLPHDVYTGQTPITENGHTNPEVIQRSADLATITTPVNPAVRAGDRAIPGTLKTLVPQKVEPPTAQALKGAATTGYNAARNMGVNIRGDAVGQMARGIQSGLQQDGVIAELAPKTYAILDKITNPPNGAYASIANMEAIRRSLQRAAQDFNNPTEQLAASRAIKGVDQFLETLHSGSVMAGPASAAPGVVAIPSNASSAGGPQAVSKALRQARGNYAAAQKSGSLTEGLGRANTGILERARVRAQAANSGRNLDNTIRQKIASLLEKPKEVSGFTDQEIQQLEKVAAGGPVRNISRSLANKLGGGGGFGQTFATSIGGTLGYAAGGPAGAVAGALAPYSLGGGAKAIANALAKRAMMKADKLVRMNSPLYQQMLADSPLVASKLSARAALTRALIASQLANRQ